MHNLPFERILDYRSLTFCTRQNLRLQTQDQAVQFVEQRGFVHFWPISGVVLPSLWVAAAGDRQVASAHEDPGHITWAWKDALLGQHQWYYAKVLAKKATMIAMPVVAYFYALSENYGAFDDDYLTQYEQGRLTQEAKSIYEAILREGPLNTVTLRRVTHLSSAASESRFNRALVDLQADFKLVPIAVTDAGAWHYAFAYDIVARHYPEIPQQAHHVTEQQARLELTRLYFCSVGAARVSDVSRLFKWKPALTENLLSQLVQAGFLHNAIQFENQTGEWYILKELLV